MPAELSRKEAHTFLRVIGQTLSEEEKREIIRWREQKKSGVMTEIVFIAIRP
jgi:hypothetical protein